MHGSTSYHGLTTLSGIHEISKKMNHMDNNLPIITYSKSVVSHSFLFHVTKYLLDILLLVFSIT